MTFLTGLILGIIIGALIVFILYLIAEKNGLREL
jgi:uncharacterized membrane-anchored protein YhcB (DUF1043 family)